jgi:hypothetical protein
MPAPNHEPLGTRDLEKGMCPSPASSFRTIALNALMLLLLFNSSGLMQWTQRLPSNAVTSWLAERAGDWDRLMHVSPADAYETVRKFLRVEGP